MKTLKADENGTVKIVETGGGGKEKDSAPGVAEHSDGKEATKASWKRKGKTG
jgi:hypothetical protein